MIKDALGDRMKEYEFRETGRKLFPTIPIYARLDGRGFSKFTKGMKKPYDERMISCMQETTKYLVEETHALIGYTQSDEISLAWKASSYLSSVFFDAKIQKLNSVLAGMASAKFNTAIRDWSPYNERVPAFDCRICQIPSETEVANMFLWRAKDARRNAISSLAQANFSHKTLQGVSTASMLKMLNDIGIVFESLPSEFRHGSFFKRIKYTIPTSEPNGYVVRSKVDKVSSPYFGDLHPVDREAMIFGGSNDSEDN